MADNNSVAKLEQLLEMERRGKINRPKAAEGEGG